MLNKTGSFIILLFLVSCSSSQTFIDTDDGDPFLLNPPPEEDLVYQTFLIGDAGAPSLEVQEPTLKLLQFFLEKAGEHSAAIFLGDNIYLNGLPDSTHPDRKFYEQRIIEQLKTVKNYSGRIFFIPGNHDWNDGKRGGLEAVNRQERFVEEYLGKGNTFIPDDGFPGPVNIKLMDDDEDPRLREDIRLIALDTQWWLHKYDKPYGDTGEYELFDAGDVLIELDDILKKQRNDFLLIAAHHPLVTHGTHGGYLPPSTHLKPPVFGSLYAIYRRVFGLEQDVSHHRYAEMVRALREIFRAHEIEDLIYASGHSHSLQYHKDEGKRINHHYLVSGSGTKEGYVAKDRGAEFTHSGKGFMSVKYYGDGSVWVEAWAPESDGSTGKLLYRNRLKEPYLDAFDDEDSLDIPDIDYSDSTKMVAPNPDYDNRSRLYEWLAGEHNRKYWSVKSEYPLFDLTEMEGGLEPIRMGGKGQSTTIHFEREDGRDYVLRSVDKEAGRIWDEELRKTVALDLAQDQFSILNPYAAVLIPDMANAIGIYHTNPKLYFIPEDPMLGVYKEEMSNQVALFEVRPNGDMSDVDHMGNSDEILSSTELFRELDNDIDHRVDQKLFAKNRLFDMLLADWDRHSDQWRWASFEPEDEKGKIYKPIPRDRDLAMMNMTGLIPGLAKILGPFVQYQNFDENYGNLKGLNQNSLALTRRFTNQLTKEDWLEAAEEIRSNLGDEVIEQAVKNYPEPVFEKYGEETIRVLKERRDKISEIAEEYYSLISRVISIPGSNKRERFLVTIVDDEKIQVQVFKLSGEGELRERYYDRTFHNKETNELRLFGMGGNDEFMLAGEASNPIKIRVIGGSGDDSYWDETTKVGLQKTVEIHETETGNSINAGDNSKVKRADIRENVHYNYKDDFRWNTVLAKLYFEYNSNDGVFLGGGPEFIQHGFRKNPASKHFVRGNYAPRTGAANIRYNGLWNEVAGKWRAELEAQFLFPKSYRNFFGLGNETTLEERSENYYRARLYQYSIEPGLGISKNILEFYAGLSFKATNVERDPNNIVTDPNSGIGAGEFDEQWFTGVRTVIKINDLDNNINPRKGYRLNAEAHLSVGVQNTNDYFGTVRSGLEIYLSPSINRQITFANRIGADQNIGNFPFYEASTLGGTTNLRGFRSRRFSGRSSLYNNTEMRIELFDFYNYLLGGKVGINGFYDVGRVWTDSESSSVWHQGYGGGIWLNIFDSFLVNGGIGFSEEGSLFTVKAGFLF